MSLTDGLNLAALGIPMATPSTIPLALILRSLPARVPTVRDNTRESFIAFAGIERADFASASDYELALDREWASEVRYSWSLYGRVRDAVDEFKAIQGTSRGTTECPSCSEAVLVVDLPRDSDHGAWNYLRGACTDGCKPEAIAEALVRLVVESEQRRAEEAIQQRASDEARRRAALLASMSPIANPPPPVQWLIPGLVPMSALSLLIGASGDGKTFELLHESICIALGIDWLGRPVQRKRALVCLLESYAINLGRIAPIVRGLGRDPRELDGWLFCLPPSETLKSDDPASMEKLGAIVKEFGIGFLGIDNLSQIGSARGENSENSSTVAGLKLDPLAQLAQLGIVNGRKVTNEPPAILLLHHAGKDGNSRGTTGIEQRADFVIELRRKNQRLNDSPITLSRGVGSRISWRDEKINMRFRGDLAHGEPVVPELVDRERPAVPSTDGKRERLLKVMGDLGPSKWTPIREELGGDPRAAATLRDSLASEGAIELRDGLWCVSDDEAE